MRQLTKFSITFALIWGIFAPVARGQQLSLIPPVRQPVSELVRSESVLGRYHDASDTPERRAYRAWKFSLIPVLASQALDSASSYGMRERNPLLADSSGRFGPQAVGIKFGATAAILGVQYLVLKKYPGTARTFSKLNWVGSAVTSGFAVHNFAIR